MPRLVQKCGYIRSGGAGGYAKYIATREGVEKLHGRGPATTRQKELIRDVLRDYPDSRELFEYEDYRANPTFSNASAFLTMALDANVHTMEEGSVYLQYIATRPRVERRGDHGLFGDREVVSLPDTMAEVEQHQGPVWTVICSLRREDAAALGYDNAERWRTLLRQHQTKMAQAMKIPADQFRWCASFHDEGHHPHTKTAQIPRQRQQYIQFIYHSSIAAFLTEENENRCTLPPRGACAFLLDPGAVHDMPPRKTNLIGELNTEKIVTQ